MEKWWLQRKLDRARRKRGFKVIPGNRGDGGGPNVRKGCGVSSGARVRRMNSVTSRFSLAWSSLADVHHVAGLVVGPGDVLLASGRMPRCCIVYWTLKYGVAAS